MQLQINPLQANLSNVSIEQLVEHIFVTRQITRFNQELLMAILLSKQVLNDGEQDHINRVFDALRRGLLKVTD
jgi:hypothetical protein